MDRPVLLVTGASRGIGAATARLAAHRGYAVAINYASAQAEAGALAAELSASTAAITVAGDVAIEADVLRIFAAVDRELGPVAALVNNAGITGAFTRVENVTAAELERVLAVNVTGTILCAREAVRRMSTQRGGRGGAIVNVSSRAAGLGSPGEYVHYAASKGAVDSFTLGLAREVAAEGIRVNAVAPGLIDTEIHARAGAPDRIERVAPQIPMRRAGTAVEVAEAILWLLSPAAAYVTGSVLAVGGGR